MLVNGNFFLLDCTNWFLCVYWGCTVHYAVAWFFLQFFSFSSPYPLVESVLCYSLCNFALHHRAHMDHCSCTPVHWDAPPPQPTHCCTQSLRSHSVCPEITYHTYIQFIITYIPYLLWIQSTPEILAPIMTMSNPCIEWHFEPKHMGTLIQNKSLNNAPRELTYLFT